MRSISPAITSGPLGTFYSGPKGVLRGGVGEFRNLLPPALLSTASGSTGLAGARYRLMCFGSAVPAPDWAAFAADQRAIPQQCVNVVRAPVFANYASDIQLFDRSYDSPRSWRANLGWLSSFRQVDLTAEGIYSLNLNQPGTVDLNFAGVPRFALAEEANRPVFVSGGSIVPGTGAVSPVESRSETSFGRVIANVSDLRSRSRQLTLTLSPRSSLFYSGRAFLSLAYTLADNRALQRGFDGATSASPSAREWARGDFDVRHQILLQTGMGLRNGISFTLFGRFASGVPFTPVIASDVNGDGLANDRAFVFDPARTTDTVVASGLRSLLSSAPSGARDCLARQAGRVAARNSCTGPWTAALNARLALTGAVLHAGNRVNFSVNLSNPLGGLDQLLHGAGRLRGWGTPVFPDPVLYTVKGFDPDAQRFQYVVNNRFGNTRPSAAMLRTPFRVTVEASFDLGTPFRVQMLERTLNRGRGGRSGPRLNADSLKARYARNVPSVYDLILNESDSLLLSREQSEALQRAEAAYRVRIDSVWTPLAEYLASLDDAYDADAALKKSEQATDDAWEIARQQGPIIKSVLSPIQLRLVPSLVRAVINSEGKLRIRIYSPG